MTIDEFAKVEMKVGTIRAAERVEGSEKLLKLQVDLGPKTESTETDLRQVLSGIGKHYAPEEIVGRQAVFVTNLDPRMMMGMESQGMLLAASNGEGIALLAVDQEVPPGSRVR